MSYSKYIQTEMTWFNATLVSQHANTQHHTDYVQSLFSHTCLTLKMKTTGKLESQEKVKSIGLLGLNWIALSLYSVSHHLHSDTQ